MSQKHEIYPCEEGLSRYKLTVEFYGAHMVGWQRQTNGPSVQEKIEIAVEKFCQRACGVYGAGRTDAGVHATAMVCHVDLPGDMEAFRVMEALNYYLKKEPVSIIHCSRVGEDFHARFSATKRAYLYHIINRRAPLTLMQNRAWQIKYDLDAEAMHEAAQCLVGKHDFTTFRSVHCQSASALKTLDRLEVRREGENIFVETAARSFLHHQVRSMVGALSYVGRGKWTALDLKASLEACDRAALAHNAPPDGLYFTRVDYD